MAEESPQSATVTLGRYLAAVREDRRLSLRQVEEATDKEVSNGYLSQLENDRIKQPSPHILYALSELYGVEYTKLMEMAGYLKPSGTRKDSARHGRAATFSDISLTEEEEVELLRFLRFIRSDRPPTSAP